ncbi:MAG: von Willebrand factor type A domain-containing protein [Thermoanaerobaculia bacterium]
MRGSSERGVRDVRNVRDIARELAESESFEPPAGLLEKIKAEIPPEVRVGTAVPGTVSRSFAPSRQRWLIAASLVAAVGASLIGVRSWESREEKSMSVEPSPYGPQSAEAKTPSQPAAPAVPPPLSPKASDAFRGAPVTANAAPEPEPPAAAKPDLKRQGDVESLGYVSSERARLQGQNQVAPENQPSPPPPSASAAAPAPAEKDALEGSAVGGRVERAAPEAVAGLVQSETRRDELDAKVRRLSKQLAEAKEEAREKKAKASRQDYDAVQFKSAGTNPFKDAVTHPLSTFGLDVDTGSYAVARRYLADGNLPAPASVRVEEWLNYFDYGDPAPAHGDFALRAEGAPSPFAQGLEHRLLRFNVKARQVKAESRRPAVLTFVIDISGSMARESRLGLVKQALSLLLDQLRPDDRVGLVVFGTHARLLLEPTGDREVIRQAVQRLKPEGSTNAEEGLALGYEVAGRNFQMNAANRIILCSDGVANVGRTGPEAILERIGREARQGIELTTLGFGMGNYNDHLMEQLADKGDGRYAYIDTLNEARRVLVDELTGTLQTVARNAKAQVEFNPVVVASYRLVGYENRAIPDDRFRDDSVAAGQVGAGHSVTALYEIELRKNAPHWEQPVATLHLRYKVPAIGNTTESIRRVGFQDFAPSWETASPSLRLTALVAELAEILKGSPWASSADLGDVARRLREVARQFPGNGKVAELADLADRAARIKTSRGRLEE